MADEILIEWTDCPTCGAPILDYGDYCEDATVGGRHGSTLAGTGTEHECE